MYPERQTGHRGRTFLLNMYVLYFPLGWYLGNLKVMYLVLIAGALPVLPVCL